MTSPQDPHERPQQQPQQPQWSGSTPGQYGGDSSGQQYAGQQYGGHPGQQYGGYPGQPEGGYAAPPYGGWAEQQPPGPPRRPGTLTAAGVIWLVVGALRLLGGIALLALPSSEFDEVRAQNPDLTPEALRVAGVVTALLALMIIGLGIVVFRGTTWARVLIAIIGGLIAVLTILGGGAQAITALPIVVAIALQFLPAANAYAAARRRHA